MPVLRNARKERYAQGLAAGQTQAEAYAAAGFKPDDGNATRMAQQKEVQARVSELLDERERHRAAAMQKVADKYAISKERIAGELARIGFANMADYTRIIGGDRVLDLSGADRDQLAAVAEITVEDFRDGRGDDARDVRRVKMKLADKRAALVDLARLFGYIVDRRDVRVLKSLEDLTDDEVNALLQEFGSRDGGEAPSRTAH